MVVITTGPAGSFILPLPWHGFEVWQQLETGLYTAVTSS